MAIVLAMEKPRFRPFIEQVIENGDADTLHVDVLGNKFTMTPEKLRRIGAPAVQQTGGGDPRLRQVRQAVDEAIASSDQESALPTADLPQLEQWQSNQHNADR